MLLAFTLLLGVAQASAEPPASRPQLICRDELWLRPLPSRRRMCLTQSEWRQRDHKDEEAARKSIYELMGNTDCLNGGMCTSD